MADYPNANFTATNPASTDKLNSQSHSALHGSVNEEIVAIETELGLLPKGAYASVSARLDALVPADSDQVKIDAAATRGYIGAASSDGVLRTGAGLSYTDGGDFVTINTIGFVDRGNLAANDFDQTGLTTNGVWQDLDLSSIIPVGTKSVYLRVLILDDVANSYLFLKNKDYADDVNSVGLYTPAANIGVIGTYQITVDSNRKIQYLGANLTFTSINITVVGWWLG